MINNLSKQYALALYESVSNKDETLEELEQLNKVFCDKSINTVLNHPLVSKDTKKEILKDSLENVISNVVLHFLFVLADNERLNEFNNVYESFKQLIENDLGILNVIIKSNEELSSETLNKLTNILKNKYNKKVIKIKQIDALVIGGIEIRIGNDVINGTIDEILYQMTKAIK